MFQSHRSWVAVIVAGLVLSCAGCPSTPSGDANVRADKHLTLKSGSGTRRGAAATKPKVEQPPPPATIPKVNLSNELRAGCLVKVGDVMPKMELIGPRETTCSLAGLYGKELTVVCFWTPASRRSVLEAAEILRSLANDIAKPFAEKGVQVIGIEVTRNFPDAATSAKFRETVSKLPIPWLEDGDGRCIRSVCKDGKLPRVYLLDAKGKILWFDVEYSRSTREDLVQGIRVALGELK